MLTYQLLRAYHKEVDLSTFILRAIPAAGGCRDEAAELRGRAGPRGGSGRAGAGPRRRGDVGGRSGGAEWRDAGTFRAAVAVGGGAW